MPVQSFQVQVNKRQDDQDPELHLQGEEQEDGPHGHLGDHENPEGGVQDAGGPSHKNMASS